MFINLIIDAVWLNNLVHGYLERMRQLREESFELGCCLSWVRWPVEEAA